MENERLKDEELNETQVIQKLTDPEDYSVDEKVDMTETQVMEQLTDETVEIEKQEDDETEETEGEKKKSAFTEVITFVRDLAVCMVIALLLTNFVVKPVRVSGRSMYPTLEDSSLGFSNILGYNLGQLKRFDVAIIYLPEKNEYLVKRVIGLPHETVSYENGQLYIDGQPVAEDFLDPSYVEQYGDSFMDNISPITLGEDEYYCLGDNRPHSTDSRYYGPFKKENIKSKGIVILWPFPLAGVETW